MTLSSGSDLPELIRMTAADAYQALYAPEPDPCLSAAIWEAALRTARTDHTPDGTGKLLLIWLAAPKLTEAVQLICGRLRTDRADVESELVLALLEGLAEYSPNSSGARAGVAIPAESGIEPLLKAAHTRAWQFARADLRETAPNRLKDLAHDESPHLEAADDVPSATGHQVLEVRIVRPAGPDGLHASLRFRVRPEHLRADTLADGEAGAKGRPDRGRDSRKRRAKRRMRSAPGRRRSMRRP
ncbi:hypothetical protein AB0D49_01250 [Streptomyces sp. NPDC048290]|uniref:hypothetical protein n=1 Tax=Streptomyces sp. NPDC048290 TaxID=3155811 RepID=UPI0034160717